MVPNGWLFTQIEHICSFKSGGTPSKQKLEYWGSDEPWISGKDLKSHYLYTSIDKLSHLGFSVAKKAPEGSSLILVRGMTLLKDFPVGYATKELAFNQDIKALIPNKGIDGLYLSFLLFGNKHKIKDLVTTAGHGTGRLDTETLKEFHVTVPPLPEQQKIAKILSTWDKAIATTEKLIATSQQQKKALMQQLLTGKKRLVRSPEKKGETGKVFEGDWEEVQQGNVATFYNGRAYKQSEWEESGTPVIRLQNLTGRGSEFYYSNLELPERQYCEFGDLLYMWSATFGPAIWHGDKAIYHYHIWKVECNESWLNKLFMYFLLDFETQKWMSQSNGMGLLHITKTTMEKQVISLPYVAEQQKIASVLTSADKEIELLQAKLAHLKQEKKALMQQLLTGKRRVKVEAPEAA